uniref:Putative secreted protein n=1 Tax=Anopheles marajoara TaxID=58244 RepID=A0A2M4C5Q0_9DIPT
MIGITFKWLGFIHVSRATALITKGYLERHKQICDKKKLPNHLPIGHTETSDTLLLRFQLHPDLGAHVKDRTVATGTDHLFVQRSLAPLAFRPQPTEAFLERALGGQFRLVQDRLVRCTVLTECTALLTHRQQCLTAETGITLLGKRCQGTNLRGDDGACTCVITAQQNRFRFITQNGLKDAEQWLRQLVLQIVVRIDRYTVFEHVDRIFGLLVGGSVLSRRYQHVRDAITELGRIARVSLAHLVGQLHVRLLSCVIALGQLLRDDELRNIDPIAQQIGDRLLRVLDRPIRVALDQQLLQAVVHEIRHQRRVIAAHRLDTLAVHLIVTIRARKVETRVTLLVDQQVRIVHLLELELDRFHKLGAHVIGRLLTELHAALERLHAKVHHHRIRVTVNDDGIVLVPILDRIPLLDLLLRVLDHRAPVSRYGTGNFQTR